MEELNNKSLHELLEDHNKALENINLALNRILTQQDAILSALQAIAYPKVEVKTEPFNGE